MFPLVTTAKSLPFEAHKLSPFSPCENPSPPIWVSLGAFGSFQMNEEEQSDGPGFTFPGQNLAGNSLAWKWEICNLERWKYLVIVDTRSWHLSAITWITPHPPDVCRKCTGLPLKRLCINVVGFSFSCCFRWLKIFLFSVVSFCFNW